MKLGVEPGVAPTVTSNVVGEDPVDLEDTLSLTEEFG